MPADSRFNQVAAVCLGILFALLTLEIGLRFSRIHTGGYFYRPDRWTAGAHRPGASGVWAKEGWARVRINSLGIRDHETTLSKPPGVFRIAMLGDSYVEGFQVDLAQTVSKVLEARLSRHGRFEVLNFGVSGYGTAQEYLQLREFALKFQPDLVVLVVTTGNDIRNNDEKLDGTPIRPYFRLTASGDLRLDDSFLHDPKFKGISARETSVLWHLVEWSWNHSRVAGLVLNSLTSAASGPAVDTVTDAPLDPALDGDWMIYDPKPSGEWAAAWSVTDKLLLATADLCREQRVAFAVVVGTNPPQVSEASRRTFTQKYPALDLDYPGHRICALCAAHKVPCLDLVSPLLSYHRRTGRLLHGFGAQLGRGHWNQDGHRAAAEAVHDFLVSNALVPAGAPVGN